MRLPNSMAALAGLWIGLNPEPKRKSLDSAGPRQCLIPGEWLRM